MHLVHSLADLKLNSHDGQSDSPVTDPSLLSSGDDHVDFVPDLKWDSALFLFRVTEEHSLIHDGVENLCNFVQSFAEIVSEKVAKKIECKLNLAEVSSDVTQEILEACVPDDLFGGLTSRYTREKYYEDHFNLVVCCVASYVQCCVCKVILLFTH